MFIRSDRLFLRPGWAEDCHELYALIQDEAIVRNLTDVPWPYRPEHAREFAAGMQASALPCFLVTMPSAQGSRVIGCAGLERRDGEIELGYWIARAHWGRGYATEAVRAVLSIAHALGHRRIVARHFQDNPASGRVLEKAGFRRTGRCPRRFSPGRGENAPTVEFAVDLGSDNDLDGGGSDAVPQMAA